MTAPAVDPREHVGPYRLLRAIGSGGSARIDLARIDRAYGFQRHVVIKRPLEHLRGDPAVAASLRREARIGGRLRHPNLVAVLDAGEHESYDYLVLEYVHGASLRTLMETEVGGAVREVPLAVALGIAIDVARGLHDAHELVDERGAPLGLVHRDVSPGNVLLGLDGSVKLADFGIAKETRVATLSGSMHGTVTYMAPEQCRGHAFDRRADVFSAGVILYELVTQTRLFWADNDVASLHRVLSGQVTRPRKLKPALSTALEEIVMRAVEQDPERRFGTARQLAEALEGLAATEGHVVGARWLARTLEQVLGPKQAPWITAATHVDPPRPTDGSLVAVIESLEAERNESTEPVWPTFGPSDERAAEEGSVPSLPMHAAKPVGRRRRLAAIVIGGIVVGCGLALVVVPRSSSRRDGPATGQPDTPRPATALPDTARPATGQPDTPRPATGQPDTAHPATGQPDTPRPATGQPDTPRPATGQPIASSHHHHRHPPVAAGSAVASPPEATVPDAARPPPVPEPAGSATKPPANVEWKPTMLLPSDSGSGSAK